MVLLGGNRKKGILNMTDVLIRSLLVKVIFIDGIVEARILCHGDMVKPHEIVELADFGWFCMSWPSYL